MIKNDLFDYPNRYIYQLPDAFKFSLDSILLAEFVKISPTKEMTILDMCTGNAPIPLILSTKTSSPIIGFELQKEIYDLAIKSVELNNLTQQITIYNEDINNLKMVFPGKYFDIITCNPPYFPTTESSNVNKSTFQKIARHELTITLRDIFYLVKNHLKENGVFYLVHRPNRLDEIILYANECKMKVKEVQLITTKNNIPSLVLVKIVKHGQKGIKFAGIININEYKTYQNIFKEE